MNIIYFILAISILIVLYTCLHYYLYRKLRIVVPAHKRALIVTIGSLALSIFIVEFLIHNEFTLFVTPLAWVSFFWMGFVVLFFGISLPIDLLVWLARHGSTISTAQRLTSPKASVLIVFFTLAFAINGVFNAQQINLEQVVIESEKIGRPLRMVQISDLHIGSLSRESYIQRIVDTINNLDADVIVSTGDLIDVSTDHSEVFMNKLAVLRSKFGKFAVYGNHETFAGLDRSRKLTEQAGFTLLSNSGVTVDGVINIFGVDDPSVTGRMQPGAQHPENAIATFSNSKFTVLLKHQPVIAQNAISSFDLQLSGHVHGGQVFPFGLLTHIFYPAPMGLSRIKDETWLYVSRGTGTWGPPMRVLAAPEITLFLLQTSATSAR